MRILILLIALSGVLAACDRDSSNEGKAAQSAAGGNSSEGKAVGSAGR